MKPSRPQSERDQDAIDRGLAAERLLGDAVVQSWFDARIADLTEQMIAAKLGDDETRRECAVEIQLVRKLKQHLEMEMSFGRNAAKRQEKK